jgi:phage tail sheath protein FI
MATYATPGVYFEPTDQNTQALTVLRTDIAAFIGIAQMGPVNVPTPVNSWEQFQTTFGNFLPNAYMAYCAKAFFENGGQTLYGVRVAANKAETTTNLALLQPADGLSSIVHSTDGFAAGALATASQTALATTAGVQPPARTASVLNTASGFPQGSIVTITQTVPAAVKNIRVVHAVNTATNTLYWNAPLDAAFDLTKPMQFSTLQHMDLLVVSVNSGTETITWANSLAGTFNLAQTINISTGASPAQGTLVDGQGNPTVLLQAQTPGVWGDALTVFVARTSSAAANTGSLSQPASGVASFLTSIVGFAVGTLVKAFQPGIAPQYRVVKSTDASNNVLVWDTPLTGPLNLTAEIWFESVEFSISVRLNGLEEEIFSRLSLEPSSGRYIEKVISSSTSRFIQAQDLHSTSSYPDRLPDPGAPQLDEGVLSFWGGRDGIAALKLKDLMGDDSSQLKWGLRTLEDIEQVSIVCCPDILIEPSAAVMYLPPPPVKTNPCLPGTLSPAMAPQYAPAPVEAAPQFSLADVANMQQAMIRHCQSMQFRVALLDPPDFGYPRQQVSLGEIQTWRNQFDSSYAALYFPWVLVSDPLLLNNQIVRRIPPSGHAAGVCAFTDTTIGVHKAPANVELQWAQDVTAEVTPEMQGFLNPRGVNCIRAFRGRGLRIYGARTLSSESSWMFLNVRRLMCMMEQAMEVALQWAVFEPNNFYLWHKITLSATNFLNALWKQGALVGNTAAEAFFVQCNQKTNELATTSLGQMLAVIGVAPTRPAEFVIFRIGRTQDTLEVQEQP